MTSASPLALVSASKSAAAMPSTATLEKRDAEVKSEVKSQAQAHVRSQVQAKNQTQEEEDEAKVVYTDIKVGYEEIKDTGGEVDVDFRVTYQNKMKSEVRGMEEIPSGVLKIVTGYLAVCVWGG